MKPISVGLNLAWQIAASEAGANLNEYVTKEYMLIGICSLEKAAMLSPEQAGLTQQALHTVAIECDKIKGLFSDYELNCTELRREIRKRISPGNYRSRDQLIHRSLECKQAFERADTLSEASAEVTCLHFFAALMESPGKAVLEVLSAKAVKPEDLAKQALFYQNSSDLTSEKEPVKPAGGQPEQPSGTHYLDKYGRDLTEEAKKGKLGPFIGRRFELLQLIQTMARKSKNNPVLVGEAGVGKTAIVEALAVRIAEQKDRQVLEGKKIIELNIGSLVGGTMYRGEFEQRLTKIIEEAKAHPEIIIFIDEIHNLIGAGRAEGSADAANIMKPALARGEVRCIGATTIAEYRRYIESDPALERRFEKVIVNEPSAQETLEILRGIKAKLEDYHGVEISDSSMEAAVNLSIRFDADHQLPDKAIDLVDKAAARARVPGLSIESDSDSTGETKSKDIEANKPVVDENAIANVLSDKIAVPVEIITGHLEGVGQNRLIKLAPSLKSKIVGQDDAINRVCNRLLLAHSGLGKRNGPLSVFMFLGPTGVGKTELAKLLAEYLFGSKSDMIRLDMSEYMEEHSTAKLIGSPPGYVGYEAEGQLTGKLRTRPYSVVLLDEVEKAHPRVLDMFLQVFDEGRLTDAKGRTVDAENAIFIMTSNIKPDSYMELPSMYDGRKQQTGNVREQLKRMFRPEFINRISDIIEFRQLNSEDVTKILKPMLENVFAVIKNKCGVTVSTEKEAEDFLIRTGFSSDFGVRELQRVVEEQVEIPLSHLMLRGELKKHPNWTVTAGKDGLAFTPTDGTSRRSSETEPV
ncbi:MAG: ATP-dependent Clp protease ATP-binding subunit [Candidatus Bathyarchaeota archaeon]|nr:ATP-dependent Clp protease ATP-binding subunit [Candidatus Bathyarchaeota archaeon]